MATAAKLIETLAAEIGWSTPTVEAYALELRRMGWWPKTKRGRGASSITDMDAAKLLLSVLSPGPKSLTRSDNDPLAKFDGNGFFLRSANMGHMPAAWNTATYAAICAELGLTKKVLFLDFIAAVIRLYIEGKADKIFRAVKSSPFFNEWDYTGPEVSFAIAGPLPVGTMNFHFADALADKLVAEGFDAEEARGPQSLIFLHQFYTWHHEAKERGESGEHWDKLLLGVAEYSAKGIRFEKSFGGREIAACARVLAGAA